MAVTTPFRLKGTPDSSGSESMKTPQAEGNAGLALPPPFSENMG